ncbi:MAG: segregation/condensation protein A [Candidatus Omnitrophica bacterium]|nr:segregation/condensation protein A [Candidatus Omnitrophota bacterium]
MKIRLEIFEGPLDLLLYLIKKNHINIYDIPVASVCEQYLQFLELMKLLDINIASEYLVIAATLINIKSKMLLPVEHVEEPVQEDPREELVKRLLEYQKFKEVANFLKEKEKQRLRYISRSTTDVASQEVFFEASIFDLINAFKTALKEVPREIFFEVVKDEFTVEDKIHDILHMLILKEKVLLDELFSYAKNKLEIIVIFLAILELIRLKEIVAIQKELFSPIIIVRRDYTELSTPLKDSKII